MGVCKMVRFRKPFDKNNVYFIVGNNNEEVFSSAIAKMIPVDDPEYLASKKSGASIKPVNSFSGVYDFCRKEGMLSDVILEALAGTGDLTAEQMYEVNFRSVNTPDQD
jgi:hypothetical protein